MESSFFKPVIACKKFSRQPLRQKILCADVRAKKFERRQRASLCSHRRGRKHAVMPATLTTANQVIDALGGVEGLQKLTGQTSQVINNWRRFKKFPAHEHDELTRALKRRGKRAPARLFSQSNHGGNGAKRKHARR